MKAPDEYILMVLFVLLLKRVHFLASFGLIWTDRAWKASEVVPPEQTLRKHREDTEKTPRNLVNILVLNFTFQRDLKN